ncbi:MAG: hypothetical protein KDD40_11840 [Bdellovibrionales bacterium]|nr:hypothetical protein [Bdellovibrionales bacterium]
MSYKFLFLLLFLLITNRYSFAQRQEKQPIEFTPMKYQHICELVEGDSPWKTLNFAPLVNPKTIELEAMFSLLIGEWREPDKWVYPPDHNKSGQQIPYHSIRVYLYPTNDYLVKSIDLSDLDIDLKHSFIGEFSNLKGAIAFAVFVADSNIVYVYFRPLKNGKLTGTEERFTYECEYNNPYFNPEKWVDNDRFGSFARELVSIDK